jgi:hypothetical protein
VYAISAPLVHYLFWVDSLKDSDYRWVAGGANNLPYLNE